jgi:type I restriction enzyme S subunit
MAPDFLQLLLASPQLRRQIEIPARSTSGVHNINKEEVRALGLPIPSRAEQDELVRRATAILEVIDRLSTKLKNFEATLDQIHQAAQERAFRGDLVATEATLATDEERDFESASEFLHRISSH